MDIRRQVRSSRVVAVAAVVGFGLGLGGCAGGSGGDPGAKPLPPGQSCKSLRAQLDRLLSRGVQSKVEALTAGRKQSAADKAEAESYNNTLNQYLGARCHV
ncbi:MAG: hypothetical protein NW216_14355 [Hyphomicrobium sp.]|nr:hypothetical protein [Hyphomicrobium sp.]